MGESNRLRSFAEDLAVFRQRTTPEGRAEYSALMKRACAQHISACDFIQRPPERRVSVWIRRRCESALARGLTLAVHNIRDNPGGAGENGTTFAPENQP
jgi:hypothetical protein